MSTALRSALRQLRRSPAFALVTTLVLGLGIGAATTVFSIVDSVVLRPLPYRSPDRLVTLWDTNPEQGLAHDPISPVTFMDYRALPVFESAAAWWRPSINLTDPGMDPVRVNTIEVSGNLFEVLGVGPALGPGFPAGGPFFARNLPSIVVSDRLWRTRYDADPALIGRQISLDGRPHTVLGVMRPGFHYPDDVDVWQRLEWDLAQHSRSAHFMEAVARLAPGVTLDQAQAAADALAARLQTSFSASNRGWATRLVPLLDEQLGYYRPALLVMFGAVGLLLVIGCLNVASLLLTRSLSRDREMAIRIAMGASPRQLLLQLLAESLVLSTLGTVVGVAAAAVLLPLIVGLSPVPIPRIDEAGIDLRVVAVAAAVLAAATTVFGLVPAMVVLRRQLATRLRSGERGSSRGARRAYSWLVASEVALACALLVSSALLVRTVGGMMATPLGIDADDVLLAGVQLPASRYRTWTAVEQGHTGLLEAVRSQPGVIAAGISNILPLEVGWRVSFALLGEPPPARPEDAPLAQYHTVSDGWFEAMGATLVEGRTFVSGDTPDALAVVVVNETFARRFLAGQRPVDRVLLTWSSGVGPLGGNLPRLAQQTPNQPNHDPTRFTVVGVVRDIRNAPLGQSIEPAIFFTSRQFPFREQFVAVRARDRAAALTALRQGLASATPGVPPATAQTWGERFAATTAEPRLLMSVLVAFGGLAALLAAVGVYGLFSWSVALRRRELAIRLTLGAAPARLGRLVLAQSATLIGAGIGAGILLVRLAQRALASVVYGVSPTDLTSTAIAGTLLMIAALAACLPPALRAMRVDPAEGLRAE